MRSFYVNCFGTVPLVPIPELDARWERHWREQDRPEVRDCDECSGRIRRINAQFDALIGAGKEQSDGE